jgi:hypothetical protein
MTWLSVPLYLYFFLKFLRFLRSEVSQFLSFSVSQFLSFSVSQVSQVGSSSNEPSMQQTPFEGIRIQIDMGL